MNEPARFIRDLLVERKLKNSSYSARALARDLGLSAAFLSQVMSGKRNLSLEQKIKLASTLVISFSDHPTAEQTKESLLNLKIIDRTIEHEKILKHWYHFAILQMTNIGPLVKNAEAIAERLSLSVVEVQTAIDRLIEFGYLKVQKNKLYRTQTPFIIDAKHSSNTVKELHQNRLMAAHQELQSIDQAHKDQRHFQTLFLATSAEKVKEANDMVTEFQKKLFSFLMEGTPDEVFQISLQIFSVENKVNKSKKRSTS